MNVTLFLLAKMFTCPEYVDDFRAGRLYANTLGYFQKLEGGGGQPDPREGSLWIDTKTSFVHLGDLQLTGDMVKPIAFQSNLTNRVNVICLYALHSRLLIPASDELPANLDEKVYRQEFRAPEDFGSYAVVVTDPEEFMARVVQELQLRYIKGSIARFRIDSVKYGAIQPSFFDYMGGKLSPLDPVFHKRQKFRYQNEYRIAFDTGVDEEEPRTLDIGDIRDITHPLRTAELRGSFGGTAVRSD